MAKIIGSSLSNIPWQSKPLNCTDAIWRYTNNPVIKRDAIPSSNSIFNSAIVPFENKFAGVFRCDSKSRSMDIFAGFSEDGINWSINHDPIKFEGADREILKVEYRYDPRVCFIEDRYWITWCNGYHGPTIGVGYTYDFKKFTQVENAFLPYNRNGVMFPRKIDGLYTMLSRPSDTGHTPFGDIFCSQSQDMTFWGKHRHVMSTIKTNASAWQSTKIGAGPIPIETTEGWLMIYHGVLNSCNGFVYSFGAALLEINRPWEVKYRTKPYLLSPQEYYECVGDVPNVVFPCAALTDASSGRIAIYYGCADTVTGLAFAEVDELVEYIKRNSL
ncbi:glycoside hydrolase family 130 protein [Candidatus Epulonipiscium viviparus]|uniref:glycoside hydrolase family 130 protein n=1 Tax=Candidatus Epulonipiscium viviparus TaxID=420336 RepID=UPI000495D541|nr:glycoside hydrolase family 130 protein [Candidatus Epulopiscium viviparus]